MLDINILTNESILDTVRSGHTSESKWRRMMSSLKRWRRVGQGQFHKWEQAGEEFEGTWRGAHEGRYGPLGTLETSEGVITFPLPAALLDRLRRVGEGAEVVIQYTGIQPSKTGRSVKAVEGDGAGDGAPAEPVQRAAASRLAAS